MELLFPEMRKTEEPSYEEKSDLLSLEVPLVIQAEMINKQLMFRMVQQGSRCKFVVISI